MSETHIINLPKRTGKLTLTELPDKVVVELWFDKIGDYADEKDLEKWISPILQKYDSDKRPIVMNNPSTGELATIFGDADNSIGFIKASSNK